MVEIIGEHRLSEFQDGIEERAFPPDELSRIRQAIESVPKDVFLSLSQALKLESLTEESDKACRSTRLKIQISVFCGKKISSVTVLIYTIQRSESQ